MEEDKAGPLILLIVLGILSSVVTYAIGYRDAQKRAIKEGVAYYNATTGNIEYKVCP